jgi:hypothetical protein
MVKKMPTQDQWEAAYKDGATRAASKWQTNFLATTGIATAAASDAAQKAYVTKMQDPKVLAVRQKKLKALSDTDFHNPVTIGGPSLYSTGINAKADKAAKGVAPVLATIAAVLPTLPAKVDDVATNINNRVTPIAVALRKMKRGS